MASTGRRAARLVPCVLAAVCYLPLLFTHVGKIGADTKQYLYLDPGRLLARAPSMWDPNVGMGTVTHQNIGYLLPLGPWYWMFHTLGIPMWIAQRMWTGTLLFTAGLGVAFLIRALRPDEEADDPAILGSGAVLVASLAYALTPYVLEYEARISAILMPWSALPWMVALVIRSLRRGGWRDPALFALVVALCGGVNATSLIYAGIAPVLWIPHAVWGVREVSLRRALAAVGRIGVLTIAGSLWWMSGLWTQARYGLDVLRYTETVKVVAQTGSPMEVLRGLGNWYFYGRDTIAPWVQPASEYTQQLWRLAVSYTVPIVALLGAICIRWRHKLYFVALVAVGMAISVGVHPYAHPSPLGGLFKAIANSSSAGLALRSVGRAVPLVALGLAILLGAGVEAIRSWRPALAPGAALVASGLVALNMAPLFTGQYVDNSLQRPEHLPAYWNQAIAALDAGPHDTRILQLPGADFDHYRWGTTLDPIVPGLTDRPFVGRELIPYGSAASADLLRALDEGLQEGVFEPSALAPIARLMNVGAVVLRSDLQYERFRTPRPAPTWQELTRPVPVGLSPPVRFGPTVPERPVVPLTDEISLAAPVSIPDPPAVAVFGVTGTAPIVHTEPAAAPLLVSGDGQGLVDAAGAGILDARQGPVLYTGAFATEPGALAQAIGQGADLLLTDTNRRRGQRWGTIRANNGYTEQAGETAIANDPTDARLPLFPGATDASFTVAELRGVSSIRATDYGNPVSYDAAHRPAEALDGDLTTAWTEGAFSDVSGARLRIDLATPVTADHINLVQPLVKPNERWITKATLLFDDGSPLTVTLGNASRTPAGQTITFSGRRFSRLDIRVDDSNIGRRADYSGASGVGFAEVRIPGVTADEILRLPTDLLDAAGAASLDHRLGILMDRIRAQPLESFVTDPEIAVRRTFSLPTARTFTLRGTGRLESTASDPQLDATIGRPGLAQGASVVASGGRLPGALRARGAAALDGNAATAWQTEFGDQEGNFLDITAPQPFRTDHLDLTVANDGRHSVPTEVAVQVDGGSPQVVALPVISDRARAGSTTEVRVRLAPVTGSHLRLTITKVRDVQTLNYFSQVKQPLPMGIAEVGVDGLALAGALAPALPASCRSDLLTIDGRPVPLQVTGSSADALRGAGFDVATCPGSPPIVLGPGTHDVRATPGRDSGIDLDRLLLSSAPGGGPEALTPLASSGPTGTTIGPAETSPGSSSPVATGPYPASALSVSPSSTGAVASPAPVAAAPGGGRSAVTVLHSGRTSVQARVERGTGAQWVVLGQSHNPGWSARARPAGGGRRVDLGPPQLVDGYANGWLLPATLLANGPVVVDMVWTPQRTVDLALAASALGLFVCLALAFAPRTRRWRPGLPGRTPAPPAARLSSGGSPGFSARRSSAPSGPAAARPSARTELITLPVRPEPWSPARPSGRPLEARAGVTLVVATAVLSGLVIGPEAALAVGIPAAIVVGRPRWRGLLGWGAMALLAGCTAYVVQLQYRYRFPTKIEWPDHFSRLGLLPWIAVAWVVVDAVIEALRSRRRRLRSRAESPAR
ncbi:MAG: hypothetical protein NVSMB12_03040 [Acidimicrobiales bacterium]